MAPAALVVSGSDDVTSVIGDALRRDGVPMAVLAEGRLVDRAAGDPTLRLVVVDLGLPGIDGIETCRRLRAATNVPILVVSTATTAHDELDEVLSLGAGADDFVRMPISPRLMRARIGAVMRRGAVAPARHTVHELGPLTLDVDVRRVSVGVTPVTLTRTEFELLHVLLHDRDRVLPRAEILERVWGPWHGDDHVIDVHLSRLRRKIRAVGGPLVGEAVPGVGYRAGCPAVEALGGTSVRLNLVGDPAAGTPQL